MARVGLERRISGVQAQSLTTVPGGDQNCVSINNSISSLIVDKIIYFTEQPSFKHQLSPILCHPKNMRVRQSIMK